MLSEGVTNFPAIADHSGRRKAGTLFVSGGGSLGWNGGAAVGMKLAQPDSLVAALTGDGSYMFSMPSTVHWMAKRYATPFLHVVYNNGGWKAPRFSTLAVHPQGQASRTADLGISFDPPPDYAGIAAAAGGAHAEIVRRPQEVAAALSVRCSAVRERTPRGRHRCLVAALMGGNDLTCVTSSSRVVAHGNRSMITIRGSGLTIRDIAPCRAWRTRRSSPGIRWCGRGSRLRAGSSPKP